ncbi:MAG: hypothetical protein KGM15_13805 [Pseudomonadota bacterium]|nr:hypothetical protein [Pseudomonadota bacterium]
MGQGPKSGRNIVAYFAGHLANLVNGGDTLDPAQDFAEIKAFSLYERVRRTLATSPRYVEGLVGFWSYPPPNEVEDAADFYFDCVLQRPIAARRSEPTTADLLAELMASHGLRAAETAAGARTTWSALTGAGGRIRRFKPQPKLFELSNRILKCLDATNRPYAEVLRLGLCPKEWLTGDDAVGVNTLKSANAFLKALKGEMRGEFGRRPTREELDAAFARAAVPGHAHAADFAASLFGAAVLARIAGIDQTYLVAYGEGETNPLDAMEGDDDAALMNEEEAAPYLTQAVAAGVLSAAEGDLLRAILVGSELWPAMANNLELRRRLKKDFGGDVSAYVEDLTARTARFVSEATGRP